MPFDALATPAADDVGVLAEVFRRRPGTLVTDHPEGRFGARGRLAAASSPTRRGTTTTAPARRSSGSWPPGAGSCAWAPTSTPSPCSTTPSTWPPCPTSAGCAATAWWPRPAAARSSCESSSASTTSYGIVDHPGEDYFATILQAYLATGRARTGRVGGATSELLDAADLVAFGQAWMTANLAPPPRGTGQSLRATTR